MRKNFQIKKVLKNSKDKKWIIFIIFFIIIYLIMTTSLVTKKYNLKEGEIAKVNIKAPREIKDEISTKAKIDEALRNIAPEYVIDSGVREKTISNIDKLINKTLELKNNIDKGINKEQAKKEALQSLKNSSSIKLSEENLQLLISMDVNSIKSLSINLKNILNEIYDNKIMDKKEDLKEARDMFTFKVNNSNLIKEQKVIALSIGYLEIKPNLVEDKEATEKIKEKTIREIQPVMIKKDQIIVKEGEPVQKYQIEILKSLGLLDSKNNFEWYIYISLAVLVFVVMMIIWYYIYKYNINIYNNNKKLILINTILCISLVLARALSVISPFLIPLAFSPMIMTLLINYNVAMTVNIISTVFMSILVGFNVEITLMAVVNAVVGVILLKKLQQRNDILYSSIYIALLNLILTFSMGFLLSNNVMDVTRNSAYSFISSLLSGILTIGFLPFFESTFDIVTTIKLLELSNPNNPLLKKLLLESPGTYHHSVLVANLSEMAAESVGGNSVLARVAAYYHDVGKIKRPYFFKENQLSNHNPHNKINPHLSTLIIISHVKDGIEMANEYKLPKEIKDIIQQHHGNTLVKYFYVTMKNNSDNPDDIKEEDFRYPGPIPQSKEAAIIMLADGVEAAVRSISEPTKGKIEEMVNNIIKGRLEDGQLDDSNLTLKDLNKIRKAFLKALGGIYHERIEYPTDKWEEK